MAGALVFPYVPINQLLSIVGVPANELENCQSGPITSDASARESQCDNPPSIASAILFHKTWRESIRVFRVPDVVVGIPMSVDRVVLRVPKYDAAVFGFGTTRLSIVTCDEKRRKREKQ